MRMADTVSASAPPIELETREAELHGHRVSYRIAGSGPVIGLIHGITSDSGVWVPAMERLADRYTVVAPDLFGHGASAKPKGDYSLGAYASGVRDLMGVLGFERGTVVGHSLGGGIALQFAYQFPEYTERMVLVSSGGLGREVHLALRAATLPGSEFVMPLLVRDWAIRAGTAVARAAERVGLRPGHDLREVGRGYASLVNNEARAAFIHTLRAVIEPGGQRVSATDRLYLAEEMPTLIVWGDRDPIIPIDHGRRAHDEIPGSRFAEIPGAGHWPQLDEPDRFCDALEDFVEDTDPYEFDLSWMQERMRQGPP